MSDIQTIVAEELAAMRALEKPEEAEPEVVEDPDTPDPEDSEDVEEPTDDEEAPVDTDDSEESDEEPSEDEAQGEPTILEIPDDEDAVFVIDGEQTPVKDVLFRQRDYTRKRQEEAEAAKAVEVEREQLQQQSTQVQEAYTELNNWYNEIQRKPDQFVESFISEQADPSLVLAQATVALHKRGLLSPDLVEQFGLGHITSAVQTTATQGNEDQRYQELAQKFEQLEQQRELERQTAESRQKYMAQWSNVKRDYDLTFDSAEAEEKMRSDLARFAAENSIWNLEHAFAALAKDKGLLQRAPKTEKKGTASVSPQKKRAAASNKNSASTGAVTQKKGPYTPESAATEAFKELFADA